MCGICGIAVVNGERVDIASLIRMRDTLIHRGPDAEGIWCSASHHVGLGHRRLSIIDLSHAATQPMQDATKQLQLVFNGEIYNFVELRTGLEKLGHIFRTQSDTEVLLAAYIQWGTDCLSRLNGMFAFAIYDSRVDTLFLARDRAGEKPLFFSNTNRKFVFASELKGLLADPTLPRHLDRDALEFYLAYGYVPGSRCILKGVRKLPPAHALKLNLRNGDLAVWRYWHLPEVAQGSDEMCTEADLTEELEHLLADSVRRQMIADVPLGVLLSGGIDSSIITALAARASSQKVRTFTISFPGHGSYDEGPFAKIVASHFGTEHSELAAEPASVDLLPMLARQFDEPICDSSIVPTFLVSRMVRQHCRVALGGDGGDELFGGYLHYEWLLKQATIREWLPEPQRAALTAAVAKYVPAGTRGRNFMLGLGGDIRSAISQVNVLFDKGNRRKLLKNCGVLDGPTPEDYKSLLCDAARGLPGQAMWADFQSYLPEDILVKVDRSSMLQSLEIRAPFLDHRVIEFAFTKVSNSLRVNKGVRKILPRRLASRLLPKELDTTRKQGFSLPLQSWFNGEWGTYFQQVLHEADSVLFDRDAMLSLIDGQRRGRRNMERLFALTMFELWRREYRIST